MSVKIPAQKDVSNYGAYKSLLLSSLVVFCLVLFCVGAVVIAWHFIQETLYKTAQADLCISCMNGGSARAKIWQHEKERK